MKKVAFFHGLESKPKSKKNDVLESIFLDVYAPSMDYKDIELFDRVLSEVKVFKPELLIGSSMGGWFAYCISTITGIPTLLFNPAVHSRPYEPLIRLGDTFSSHEVILGKLDTVITPNETVIWVSSNGIGHFNYNLEDIEHRIPIEIFTKYLKHYS